MEIKRGAFAILIPFVRWTLGDDNDLSGCNPFRCCSSLTCTSCSLCLHHNQKLNLNVNIFKFQNNIYQNISPEGVFLVKENNKNLLLKLPPVLLPSTSCYTFILPSADSFPPLLFHPSLLSHLMPMPMPSYVFSTFLFINLFFFFPIFFTLWMKMEKMKKNAIRID